MKGNGEISKVVCNVYIVHSFGLCRNLQSAGSYFNGKKMKIYSEILNLL